MGNLATFAYLDGRWKEAVDLYGRSREIHIKTGNPVEAARASGATGVMLDTAGKGGGSLTDHRTLAEIGHFVARARNSGLQVGLAGSLRARHVQPLLRLQPDVIGFRGALCEHGARGLGLDAKACAEIGRLVAAGPEASESRFEARAASAMC